MRLYNNLTKLPQTGDSQTCGFCGEPDLKGYGHRKAWALIPGWASACGVLSSDNDKNALKIRSFFASCSEELCN